MSESVAKALHGGIGGEKKRGKLELTNYTILVKDFLPHTDWPNARRTFTVDYIDGRRLILHAGDTTYTFHRY